MIPNQSVLLSNRTIALIQLSIDGVTKKTRFLCSDLFPIFLKQQHEIYYLQGIFKISKKPGMVVHMLVIPELSRMEAGGSRI
jgi:hypothetical protein